MGWHLRVIIMIVNRRSQCIFQVETNLRMDFLCKSKIDEDKDIVKRNELVNELLLANILPRHAAEHFIRPNRNRNVNIYLELYLSGGRLKYPVT